MTTSAEPHGVLVVDKARGPTSHDVVGVARRALGTRAIGHTGTLDPMATGVLVLAIGEATKLVNMLGATSKHYETTIKLGESRTTLDAEGELDGEAPVPSLTREQVSEAAQRFVGERAQRAPAVSAIKVAGQSLYKRARKGEAFETPLRTVRLDAVEVQAVRGDEIELSLCSGPGFYVRAFARDLAAELGTLGHLTQLRRSHNGAFDLTRAVSFDALLRARDDEPTRALVRAQIVPFAEVCRSLAHVVLDAEGVVHARHGRAIAMAHVVGDATPLRSGMDGAPLVALDEEGTPIALLAPSQDGQRLAVARGFRFAG